MMHFQSFRGPKTSKLHTNGIADVSSNSNIGASTSAESFSARKQVESSRQHVGGYRGARIYKEHSNPARPAPLKTVQRFQRAPTTIPDRQSPSGTQKQPGQPGAGMRSSTPIRAPRPGVGFRDAPSRGFNPYA